MPDTDRTQHALQDVALEPFIEQIRDRHGQDPGKIDDGLFAEPAHKEAQASDPGQLARISRFDIGRWGEVQLLEHARQRPHPPAEVRPLCRVGGTDASNGLYALAHLAPQLKAAGAVQGYGYPGIGLLETEAMLIQLQLAHHLCRHPADVESCLQRFALLDDEHPFARAREVVRRHEAVGTGADHDRVVARLTGRAHLPSLRMRSAARRPEAPMIPPPGCVPEPH